MFTALDSETFLIAPGNLAPTMVCVSWARDTASGVVHANDPGAFEIVAHAINEGHTIYANAPFDLAVFARKWPTLLPDIFKALDEDRVHDVQTREKLLDLARGTFRFEEDEDGKIRAKGYSLFDLALRRLGRKLDKDEWRMRYHDLWDVPIEEWPAGAIDYADSDAVSTLQIFEAQESLKKYLGNATAQVRAHFALHLMACRGFRTNPEAVDRLEVMVRERIDEVRADLEEIGLVRPDGSRDTKTAKRLMVETLGDEVVFTTKGLDLLKKMEKSSKQLREDANFISLSEDSCVLSAHPHLLAYSTYTRYRNLLTGSVKHLRRGVTTPIQTRYEILMETGRTSSSAPNVQNLRRAPGVRECFVPRPGYVLIACDYSAAELHTLAQVCLDLFGESKLADALNEGIDVHALVGSQIVGIDYADLVALIKAGDVESADARQLAKAANFGFPGGCGAKRFVGQAHGYGLNIEIRDAARLKATWLRAWPEMRSFFDYVGKQEDDRGFYWVKQLRAERLRARCTYTSACNSYFQGLAADGAKAAAYEVAKAQRCGAPGPLVGTYSLAFIHDEIIVEAPEETAHEAALALSAVMERAFNRFVPDVPTKAEPTVMRYWSKKAKQTWDGDRLIPWEG